MDLKERSNQEQRIEQENFGGAKNIAGIEQAKEQEIKLVCELTLLRQHEPATP
jgi:hypothetical protein